MATLARNHRSLSRQTTASSSSSSTATITNNPSNANNNQPTATTDCCTQKYLTRCKSLYSCIHCRTHLANHDELVSRSFQGNHGRAYLFNSVVNISCGPAVQRQLNTGSHAVADIYCSNCERILGWKYEKAYVETQKYKEGKYIIELAHVVRENRHLELDKGEMFLSRQLSKSRPRYNSSLSGSNGGARRQQPVLNSYSEQSSSQLSSPTDSALDESVGSPSWCGKFVAADEDVDDELLFPFYDDLCANRSSYPGSLSVSHHERKRRSLYLESKPYDWKNSPPAWSSSSLASSPAPSPRRLESTSNDSPLFSNGLPSPASTSGSSQPDKKNDDDDDDDYEDEGYSACRRAESSKASKRPRRDANEDASETQFELEDDTCEFEPTSSATANCGTRDSDIAIANGPTDERQRQQAENQSASGRQNSINLDDEEFFDCYTEHEVLNSLSPSRG